MLNSITQARIYVLDQGALLNAVGCRAIQWPYGDPQRPHAE